MDDVAQNPKKGSEIRTYNGSIIEKEGALKTINTDMLNIISSH